ncbi:hypothetical protein GTO89_04750 [Heliobacterium gestii]|uniref:Uncharacterized protein n=1 Tax=Heliomicrobium gestii TaxID=2699 RepID=A0A845LBQ2_HELGE|nr:hypothetical protein [Heliomicrobium gestii]MBM7866924.1 hypothetical protein [Heliomicrobium gestii]MZP42350.1 hypothetical protein [Heliomicrobium gestii]
MQATTSRDFWTAVDQRKPYIEVSDESLIRRILLKHHTFRFFGLTFLLTALGSAVVIPLILFRYIPSDSDVWFLEEMIDLLELLDFDVEVENEETLWFVRNFMRTYVMVFIQGWLARFFYVRTINGKYSLRRDPAILSVDHRLSPYTSRFLGIRFYPTVPPACPECGQESVSVQGILIQCAHCQWVGWKRGLH